MNKLKFDDFSKIKNKNNTLTVNFFVIIYKITLLFTLRKEWSSKQEEESALLHGLSILLVYVSLRVYAE